MPRCTIPILLLARRGNNYRTIYILIKPSLHIAQILVWLLLCMPALSQERSLTELMLEAFQELDYERAEVYASEILASYKAYPIEELTQVHTTLGMIKYAQNSQAEARSQFEAALSLSPELELDPALVSPKIMVFFNELKTALTQNRQSTQGEAQVRYILLEDPRPAAAMRSLALPGWGQMYKGERRKGVLLMGAWGITAGATLAAHLSLQEARSQYRKSQNPDDIGRLYDRYNNRNKIRNGLAVLTAGVWLYSYIDALSIPVQLNSPQREAVIALRPAATYPFTQVHFSLSF